MTTPRVKRSLAGAASDPAQRPITSFFARDVDDVGGVGDRPAVSASRGSSPPLPPAVQASLLAVGMRVRKSVPEGYKTKEAQKSRGRPAPTAVCAAHELVPFCGLHRIGGLDGPAWDAAPLFAPGVFAGEDDEDDDGLAVPSLTSSQETVPDEELVSRKRQHALDEEDEDEEESVAASYPRGRRVLAVPRRRQKPQHPPQQLLLFKSAKPVDQENGSPADDFEDADFLEASTWAERDFEMGGC